MPDDARQMKRAGLTGLMGGSFNPAHRGHRRISLFASEALSLDDYWWLVSPGNPLKPAKGMAPLNARLRSARKMARHSRITPTVIEKALGTRYTVDTLAAIKRKYPKRRFIWIMGADNLVQFHEWRDWRKIAAMMPIAVIARPGYEGHARASRALAALRKFVRPASCIKHWTEWRPPALVLLQFRPDKSSATEIRRAHPDWFLSFPSTPLRDPLSRRMTD
jgi:nicotinate-nucleotide adenylyltransferase